ncbi:hypothetical protein ACJOYG_18740 [Acinetobacter baumannii]
MQVTTTCTQDGVVPVTKFIALLNLAGLLYGSYKMKSLRKQNKRFNLKDYKKCDLDLGNQIGEVIKRIIQKEKRQGGLLSK